MRRKYEIIWVCIVLQPFGAFILKEMVDYREKDGYTVESVDIYGLENGVEKVIISGVRLISFIYMPVYLMV